MSGKNHIPLPRQVQDFCAVSTGEDGGKSYLSVLPVVEELHGECSAEIW